MRYTYPRVAHATKGGVGSMGSKGCTRRKAAQEEKGDGKGETVIGRM